MRLHRGWGGNPYASVWQQGPLMRLPLVVCVVLAVSLIAWSPAALARELDGPRPEMDPLARAPQVPDWPIEGSHAAYEIEVSSAEDAARVVQASITLAHRYAQERWRGSCEEDRQVREQSERGTRSRLRMHETTSVINLLDAPPGVEAPGIVAFYPACEKAQMRVGPGSLKADGLMHAAPVDDATGDITWDPQTRLVVAWDLVWEGARVRGELVDADARATSLPSPS